MTRKILLLALLPLVLAVGCGSGIDDDTAVATVGERTITVGEYREAVDRLPADERPDFSELEARESFLQDMVNKNLLELASHDLVPELPLPVQWRMERARRTLVTNKVRNELIRNQVTVTEADKDLAYEISTRDLLLDAILVPDESMAEALRKRIDGGESFEDLCIDYSIREGDPGKQPWELGWVAMSRFKWPVERYVWQAKKGDIVGPVQNVEGWWIFRVVDMRPSPAEADRQADDARLEQYVLDSEFLARAGAVGDSLWAAAGVGYTVEGQQLLLRKYYWEPPAGMEDDPMAFLNDPRVKPSFTAAEETVTVVTFTDQPSWSATEFADRLEWYGSGLWPRGHSVEQLTESMDMVVRDHLMLKAGDDLGYTSEKDYLADLNNRTSQMRVNYLYNNVIVVDAEPTEEDIQAWFSENRERYKANPSYRLAAFWSKDEQAMRDLAEAWRNGASFSELRETYEGKVDDLQYEGDTAWLHMGNDIALDDAVTPVADGAVGEPFLREGTWFVFKVLDRRGERLTSYEEVKDLVDRDAATMAKERALVNFLDEQRQKFPVVVHEDVLAGMEIDGSKAKTAS